MTAKRCFVISPIGQAGSEIREHADDVFDYIIKPALEEVGMTVYRADHEQKVGRITDQMFESILNDDLCIAILSFQNPNVFYELAVAQSAARPVIILNEKGHPLPFDLKDLRVIEYTLRPRPIFDKVYVKQIVEMIHHLEAQDWVVPVPFGSGLSPLGRSRGSFLYRERLESFGLTDQWLAMLKSAERAIDLSGIHLRYWSKMTGFRPTIENRAAAGCRIRFLIMDPDNPALPQYFNRAINFASQQTISEVSAANVFFRELAAAYPNVGVRQMRVGCHHQNIVRIDDQMFASLILYSEMTRRCPLIECNAQSTFFSLMLNEFDALWDANAETTSPLPLKPVPPAGQAVRAETP
jgi:hypothetical protein